MIGMRATAPAKINLLLRVRSRDATGMHPLTSLVQSIGWHDILTLSESDEDELSIAGADLPTDGTNLVWKAVHALRSIHRVDSAGVIRVDQTCARERRSRRGEFGCSRRPSPLHGVLRAGRE